MDKHLVDEYLDLPYTIEVIRDNDPDNPGWVARVMELPGCITQGENFKELGEMIEDAVRGWIEAALADNLAIPKPRLLEEYSGKFVVRIPKSLHRELVEAANRDGVSLNSFVNVALAKVVGGGKIRISSHVRRDVQNIGYKYNRQEEIRYIREKTENESNDGDQSDN